MYVLLTYLLLYIQTIAGVLSFIAVQLANFIEAFFFAVRGTLYHDAVIFISVSTYPCFTFTGLW